MSFSIDRIKKLEDRVKTETVEEFLKRGGQIKKVEMTFEPGRKWKSNFVKWKMKQETCAPERNVG